MAQCLSQSYVYFEGYFWQSFIDYHRNRTTTLDYGTTTEDDPVRWPIFRTHAQMPALEQPHWK